MEEEQQVNGFCIKQGVLLHLARFLFIVSGDGNGATKGVQQ
jgi:hypothetical protein